MGRVEPQQKPSHDQSAVRQQAGATMASPQGRRITQLETLIDASPAMVTQRKLINAIASSAFSKAQSAAPLQAKLATLQLMDEEDEKRGTAQRAVKEEELDLSAQSTAQLQEAATSRANNTGLPDNLKSGIETLSGISMDSVKVHYNSPQPAQLNALAYAQGNDIHVAPGQEQHLPHEAWHVVQQAQGRVKPTLQMKEGVPVNDDKALEQEADVMGARALQLKWLTPVQRAAVPEDIKSHKNELDSVMSDIKTIKGPKNKTNEPLENTIDGAENWASETRYAAKRKYVEYQRASEAYTRGAEEILLGEDTTTQSDIEYWEGGAWVWEESKLVNGEWPQFGVNVLAARKQCAERTQTGGIGIASITLSDDFYLKAWDTLRLDENGVKAECINYLTKSMRKKTPSQTKTRFFVRVGDNKGGFFTENEVTKWHRK